MNIFISDPAAATAELTALSPVPAFHWQGLSIPERQAGQANPASPFVLTTAPETADLHVLPYEWNHYIWTKDIADAQRQAAVAARLGKQLLVWHSGDLPPVIPIPNVVAFQSALYRSRLKPHQHAAPSFVRNPLAGDGRVTLRPKRAQPVVGFCGYAGVVPLKIAYGIYAALGHNIRHVAGRAPYEAIPVWPATLLRARALRRLAADPRVTHNFQVSTRAFKQRDKTTDAQTRARQIADFDRNVRDSDYTLCVRGYGNWSRRFYETLACGRIPVFIDTDCVLPGAGRIDWQEYCVWVDDRDVDHIADRVVDFHARLGPEGFAERQRACRALWEDWLSPAGFMAHLPALLGFRPAFRHAVLIDRTYAAIPRPA